MTTAAATTIMHRDTEDETGAERTFGGQFEPRLDADVDTESETGSACTIGGRLQPRETHIDGPPDVLFAVGEDVVHLRSPPGDGLDEGHIGVAFGSSASVTRQHHG